MKNANEKTIEEKFFAQTPRTKEEQAKHDRYNEFLEFARHTGLLEKARVDADMQDALEETAQAIVALLRTLSDHLPETRHEAIVSAFIDHLDNRYERSERGDFLRSALAAQLGK